MTGGDNPDMVLVRRVLDHMSPDPSAQTDAEQLFELLYHFNAFVLWNGFNGYLDGYDWRVPEVIEGLRTIGAEPYARMLGRAVEAKERPEELGEIAGEYYEFPTDLYEYMARFARTHPDQFGADVTEGA